MMLVAACRAGLHYRLVVSVPEGPTWRRAPSRHDRRSARGRVQRRTAGTGSRSVSSIGIAARDSRRRRGRQGVYDLAAVVNHKAAAVNHTIDDPEQTERSTARRASVTRRQRQTCRHEPSHSTSGVHAAADKCKIPSAFVAAASQENLGLGARGSDDQSENSVPSCIEPMPGLSCRSFGRR